MNKFLGLNILIGATLIGCLALTSCGKDKANALRDYSVVAKTLQQPDGQKGSPQALKAGSFRITALSDSPEFVEGYPGTAKFKLELLDSDITAAVLEPVPGTFPDGAGLQPSTNEKDVWIFKWTPPTHFVDATQSGGRQVTVQVQARVLQAKDDRLMNFSSSLTQNIIVTRSKTEPTILNNDSIPSSALEGVETKFSISVTDPANKNLAPVLKLVDYDGALNAENPKLNFRSKDKTFIIEGSPKISGPDASGVFTYNYVLLVKLPPGTQSGIDVCFNASLMSTATQNSAPHISKCITVMREEQAPVINWKSDPTNVKNLEEVVAGAPNTINFNVTTLTGKGNVQVDVDSKRMQALLKSMPSEKGGEAVLDCGDQKVESTNRECSLKWTPSCKKMNVDKQGTLKIQASTTKTTNVNRIFKVVSQSCEGKSI